MNDLAKEFSKQSDESAIWFLNVFGKMQKERGKLRKGLINIWSQKWMVLKLSASIYGKWCLVYGFQVKIKSRPQPERHISKKKPIVWL